MYFFGVYEETFSLLFFNLLWKEWTLRPSFGRCVEGVTCGFYLVWHLKFISLGREWYAFTSNSWLGSIKSQAVMGRHFVHHYLEYLAGSKQVCYGGKGMVLAACFFGNSNMQLHVDCKRGLENKGAPFCLDAQSANYLRANRRLY